MNDAIPSATRDSIPQRLLAAADLHGDAPAYWTRGAETWEPTSWRHYAAEVQQAARALIALGLPRGGSVAILGFNRPEWAVMAQAAMLAGGKLAGIYWTSAPVEVEYVLGHAQAHVLLVENAEQAAKVGSGGTAILVAMRGPALAGALDWDEFLAKGTEQHAAEVSKRLGELVDSTPAVLIYTSGTTGNPKAVTLTQRALTWTSDALCRTLASRPDDRVLSYLPLAHIAEQMVSIHAHVRGGYQLYYAQSLEALGDHLKEVHPTIFFGVPRVWERMQKGIQDKLVAASGLKPKLARWAMAAARKAQEKTRAGGTPGWLSRLQRGLADALILRKVRAALGLDQARWTYTGAAPLSPDTVRFFAGLDLTLREVYGLSETCGPTTLGTATTTPIGSVGQAISGVVLRVAEDDELLIKGPNLFAGYLNQPEATADALRDGWFHSGDLARIDEAGNVFIIGRKKDLLITSGGKNISPANIEADLMNLPLIEHAVVCGDGRHFLTALLALNPEAAARLASELGVDPARLPAHPRLRQILQGHIDEINTLHARAANIRKFTVLDAPLSIAAGELTATLKIRRQQVIRNHHERIEAMYLS